MKAKRKKIEKLIVETIDKIAPGGENKKLYVDMFRGMSDKQFHSFMEKLKKGKVTLSVIAPNVSKVKLDVERNYKIAEELGKPFFQQLKISGDGDLPDYMTPNKYLVLALPVRRAAQLLTKKVSIPSDDKSIDLTTGQVTGKSKGSKLTLPEIQVLAGMGVDDGLKELMKIRGGDLGAKNAMSALLMKNGSVSQQQLEEYATGVVSTKTLSSYFRAAHINPENL